MRSRVAAFMLLLSASICSARPSGPPVTSLGWGGCGSYAWSGIRASGLSSAPLYRNYMISTSSLGPLNPSMGYLVDDPNFQKDFLISLMQAEAVFPFAPDTGRGSVGTTFNVFGIPTQIQVTIDQNQKTITVSFTDPFDGTAQNATGTYLQNNIISTNAGTQQRLSGDPFATGLGEQLQTPRPDLVMDGPFPVVFRRYYASFLSFGGTNGALGNNWLHNYDVHLYLKSGYASIVLADGTNVYFRQSGGRLPAGHSYELSGPVRGHRGRVPFPRH